MSRGMDTRADDDSPFALACVHHGRGLDVTVTGRLDGIEPVIAMFRAIAVEAGTPGCDRILVLDHTTGVVPGEAELHRLVASLHGSGLAGIRLAYVDARGTAVARMEVAEIVGREHGYDCRVFDNEARARIWLDYGVD